MAKKWSGRKIAKGETGKYIHMLGRWSEPSSKTDGVSIEITDQESGVTTVVYLTYWGLGHLIGGSPKVSCEMVSFDSKK